MTHRVVFISLKQVKYYGPRACHPKLQRRMARSTSGQVARFFALAGDHQLRVASYIIILFMYYVYLIQRKVDKSYYIGYTSDLRKRIQEHNYGKTKSIKHKIPYMLIYYEAYTNKTCARKREIKLKTNSYRKEQLLKRVENIIQ